MEGLIPIIIALLLSVFFKSKKEPDKKTVENPVNRTPMRKTISENPFKDLGDFAKQFTSERQQEMKTKPPIVKEVPVKAEKMGREVKRNQGVARTSSRLSTHQENASLQESTPVVSSILPSNEDELIKAIIFSEILAPPKSKR